MAEGFAKQTHSKAEFARFVSMAIGSCSEVETWISYAFDLEYISQAQLDEWQESYAKIYGMLVNLREALKRPLSSIPHFFSSSIPPFFMFWPYFRLRSARIVDLGKCVEA
ncbi:hypothetical protein MPLB_640006 [Mesorhizobium sp. ORS 3324]|nr:hypothetical protein MPLB_640006 [Mesorhizobium sp. ORS 3324]